LLWGNYVSEERRKSAGALLTVKRDVDGKKRATAMTWADAKVIECNEVIEVHNVEGYPAVMAAPIVGENNKFVT
jgi:hypothetical protein